MLQILQSSLLSTSFDCHTALNAISHSAYQFAFRRKHELYGFYNPGISSDTIGCVITILSFGLLDVFVGGGSTLVFCLGVGLLQNIADYSLTDWFEKIIFQSSFNFHVTIAAELNIVAELPFFLYWFTTGIGWIASLIIGAIIIGKISSNWFK